MGRGDNRRTIKMQRRAGQRRKKRQLRLQMAQAKKPVTVGTKVTTTPINKQG